MSENKICPECECEYLPHVDKCADCGSALIHFEEYRKAKDEQRRLMEKAVEDAVVVRKGDLKWLGELYNVLIGAGIACSVQSGSCCNKGCQGDEYLLLVQSADADRASERIEEYFAEMHPEALASQELISEGKCPACGSPVGAGDKECPDCGLMLVLDGDGESG